MWHLKIYTLAPRENWICDRFVQEWNSENQECVSENIHDSELVWLLADWCWNQIDPRILSQKKVVASVHHITPSKFKENEAKEFLYRDQFVDAYHVPCHKTKDQIVGLTNKPIYTFPFWVNQNMWKNKRLAKAMLRQNYGLRKNDYLIGSFQRDTEGHDLITPKLEKGPDLFCDAVERFHAQSPNVSVVLAGWRRQYVINRLEKAGIHYDYFELPSFDVINDLYNCLDLYIVAARYEGGPQAIVECAVNGTPIISTDVGLASEILSSSSIFEPGNELNAEADTNTAYSNVMPLLMPSGFNKFHDMFREVLRNAKS